MLPNQLDLVYAAHGSIQAVPGPPCLGSLVCRASRPACASGSGDACFQCVGEDMQKLGCGSRAPADLHVPSLQRQQPNLMQRAGCYLLTIGETHEQGVQRWEKLVTSFGRSAWRGTFAPISGAESASCRVAALLDSGHDPAASDSQGRKAYWLCKFKSTRDAFRRHMAAHPDACDWDEAGVHEALTPQQEAVRAKKKVCPAAR